MSAILDKNAIRELYNSVETGEMTWAKANQVYEMGEANVEMYPWAKEDSTNDWIALYTFLHPQVTETPQPPADDMRAPALRILRRLANRVIESGRPVTDMDAMVPESELSTASPGLSNVPMGPAGFDWNAAPPGAAPPPPEAPNRTLPSYRVGDRMVSREEALARFRQRFARSQQGGAKRKSQTAKFCRCIKEVRKTIRPRKGSTKESAAIGVCVKSVLHSKGRTVKKFKCGKKSRLVTQKRK